MAGRYKTFREFWPYYVGEHRNRINRRLHFIGTTIAFVILINCLRMVVSSFLTGNAGPMILLMPVVVLFTTVWHFLALVISGYGFAWAGHFFFEKNKPATFTYPLWSLRGDLKMYSLMWQRRMDQEIVQQFPDRQKPTERGKILRFPR